MIAIPRLVIRLEPRYGCRKRIDYILRQSARRYANRRVIQPGTLRRMQLQFAVYRQLRRQLLSIMRERQERLAITQARK